MLSIDMSGWWLFPLPWELKHIQHFNLTCIKWKMLYHFGFAETLGILGSSDIGSKWWLLCSLLHPTTDHLNRLGAILVNTCSVDTMADCLQFTQGRSKVKHQCQSTIVGGAWVCVTSHVHQSENGLIWERGYLLGLNKKHWVDFYHYRVVVYTRCQDTFQFKHVKVNFAFYDLSKTLKNHINLWKMCIWCPL